MKIPKETVILKLKQEANLTDEQIQSKVKDKLDQLSGLISEEGALHIIANELGIKVFENTGKLQIKNLVGGMRSVELTGKVVRIYEVREFNTNNRKGKVGAFLIGDGSGVVRVVAWNDKADLLAKLNPQMGVTIKNAYSRENQGRLELHLGDKAEVELDADASDIEVQQKLRKKVEELEDNMDNVEIMGTVVQVFDPRFFAVDPDSGRRATEKDGEFYYNDKKIDPDYSYVTNLFVDDGTDNIRVVCWKNQTQRLFDVEHEVMVKNRDQGFEDMKTDLLGKIVKFVGRTKMNEMFDRIEFVPNLVITDVDPVEEAKNVEKEIKKADEDKEEASASDDMPEPRDEKKSSSEQQKKTTSQPTKEPAQPKAEKKSEDKINLDDIDTLDLDDLDKL